MVGVAAAAALVAHLSVMQGGGWIARTEGGGVTAARNAPLLAGDVFSSASGAGAEIALDGSVAIRVDESTSVRLVSLAGHHRQIALASGTIDVSADAHADSPRVDTPEITVAPDAPALVRIAVARGATAVVVRRGTARLLTPNGMQVLSPGELVTVTGNVAAPSLAYASPAPHDAFDGFNDTRDAQHAAARDPHLAAALNGVTNFAAYGTWETLAHGVAAWQPREPAHWSPYHAGRWLWRPSVGWTWIARESWGWLPSHYGAWTHDARYGWCWVPPASAKTPPAWSAATAAFFAVIVRGRTQDVGWLPLAPSEPYHVRLEAYVNAAAPDALAVVSRNDFYSANMTRVASAIPVLPAETVRLQAPPPPATRERRR